MLSLRVREPACTLVWLSLRTTSGSAARLGRVNAAHRHGPSGREFPTERSSNPRRFRVRLSAGAGTRSVRVALCARSDSWRTPLLSIASTQSGSSGAN